MVSGILWYKTHRELIDTFCKMKGIDIEEVAKVEEQAKYTTVYGNSCGTLENISTVTSQNTPIPYSEENFRALESNYNNLLEEYEKACSVIQALKAEKSSKGGAEII